MELTASRLLTHFDRLAETPDAVARLRRFVLDLAVRGKLVEQDPAEEPASELLKRIEEEKSRLVKSGKLRKERPSEPLLTGEEPFVLPSGWEWARVRQVACERGQKIPDAEFTYIDVTAIDNKAGRIATPKVLAAADAPSRARKIVQAGDVIYSCVRPYLLNIAVVESDIQPAPIASTAFAVLNGFGLVVSEYLWIVLRSPFMVEAVEAKMRGQAYPAINDADFGVLPIPLPPSREQERIVVRFTKLMTLCDRLESTRTEREARRDRLVAASLNRLDQTDDIENFLGHARFHLGDLSRLVTRSEHTRQLRQSILTWAINGRLIPQDPTDESIGPALEGAFERRATLVQLKKARQKRHHADKALVNCSDLPKKWVTERLGNLVDPENTISYGVLVPGDNVGDGIPFVRAQDLTLTSHPARPNKTISPDIERPYARTRLRGGEILLCVVGSIGKLGFVPPSWAGANIARAVARIMPIPEVSRDYLLIVLQAPQVQTYFTEATRTLAQPTLNVALIEQSPIPLPPLAEQHRIVAKVAELMALCDRLETQFSISQTVGRSLLEVTLQKELSTFERVS